MPYEATKEVLWNQVKNELRKHVGQEQFDIWFAGTRQLDVHGSTLIVGVPSDFTAYWLSDNFMAQINQAIMTVAGREMKVELEMINADGTRSSAANGEKKERANKREKTAVDGEEAEGVDAVGHVPNVDRSARNAEAMDRARSRMGVGGETWGDTQLRLNAAYTFDSFVVGGSNEFAYAACRGVAETPAEAHNPLFLYGASGLGKTHLMHSIAQETLRRNKKAKVLYLTCETFTNEFIRAIKENSIIEFRRFYRGIDMLLLDDVQFLRDKERIQEEFFHTFNSLFESQRQICLSCDRPASEIGNLTDRLLSRFQWGMVADIQPPDLETRTAIISKKLQSNYADVALPPAVVEFLAQRITNNVRVMEGALARVAAMTRLSSKEMTVEGVQKVLADVLQREQRKEVTIDHIKNAVVDMFNLRLPDMTSRRRPSHIAFPRQIAMYLSRILTGHSLSEIGNQFGGRDHGTVIYACKTVEDMMEQDQSVEGKVKKLMADLQG